MSESQNKLILEYLEIGNKITPLEALNMITQKPFLNLKWKEKLISKKNKVYQYIQTK
jgi:hypothetical protein